ncbi:hypothetical protein [Riemerella columbipharyngis]|uniref:Uncharacterized protein n=1 Tax=Riemerella columbipharyngis TaxID=1071918 RepID=A0A1G7FMS3_9FLAO|nr:hypothetical protein [Riemerella columbipharyngis]SDE77153.1 hypothetical protein SAMN05421544_12424 [Riemerella columbipharyngis]
MLNKEQLKNEIKAAFLAEQTEERDYNASLERICTRIANAIDTFVKSGVVTVQAGIPVSTAGNAISQTGATTSTGTGTIS